MQAGLSLAGASSTAAEPKRAEKSERAGNQMQSHVPQPLAAITRGDSLQQEEGSGCTCRLSQCSDGLHCSEQAVVGGWISPPGAVQHCSSLGVPQHILRAPHDASTHM